MIGDAELAELEREFGPLRVPDAPDAPDALDTAREGEGVGNGGEVQGGNARPGKVVQGARFEALDTGSNRCYRLPHGRCGRSGGSVGKQGVAATLCASDEHALRSGRSASSSGGNLGPGAGHEIRHAETARRWAASAQPRRNGTDAGARGHHTGAHFGAAGMGPETTDGGEGGEMNEAFHAALYLAIWGGRPSGGGRVIAANAVLPGEGRACPLDPSLSQARAVAEEILDALEDTDPRDLKRAVVQASWGRLMLAVVDARTTPTELVECVKAVKALAGAGGLKRASTRPAISPEMIERIDALLASRTETHIVAGND